MIMELKMSEKMGFALIGAGVVADQHAHAMAEAQNARLVTVISRTEEHARNLAEKHSCDWTTDLEKALLRADVDAVSICTPSGLHMQSALDAFAAGKHVLCEKPIEVTLEKADRMTAAAKKSGCRFGIVFQNHFRPEMIFLRDSIRSGKLGNIVMGEAALKWYRKPEYYQGATWRATKELDGGGCLANQGIHFLDLLLWLMGEVDSLYAAGTARLHDIKTEDTIIANLRFASGALGVVQCSTACFPSVTDRVEICGSRGSVVIQNGKLSYKYFADEDGTEGMPLHGYPLEKGMDAAAKVKYGPYHGHTDVVRDFADAVINDREPLVTGEWAKKSLRVLTSIYESASSGKPVVMSGGS